MLKSAAQAVAAVLGGRTPDGLLAKIDTGLRPAVLDLTYSTLRDYGRGDFLLSRLMTKPLKHSDTHALLLVALMQLERRPETAHTVVDQAVAAVGQPWKALTNAVLRNYLRQRDPLLAAAANDPVAHWRHPRWWLDMLKHAWPEHWPAIAAIGNTHPPMCLRTNRRRPPAEVLSGRTLADNALLLDHPVPIERLPGFLDGCVSVQDWGAQHAAPLLDVRSGQRVLDACAAPGGKTAHLLELADIELTALEIEAERAGRIVDNLVRLGLPATVRVADARQPNAWWDGRPFDRILADVPCSASGVARRHPDSKWLRRATDVAAFVQVQADIVDALWPLLAPGGKMLYCTCSVFPAENSDQMRAFVMRHPDARRLSTGDEHTELQLFPTPLHDGFYYALLEKTS